MVSRSEKYEIVKNIYLTDRINTIVFTTITRNGQTATCIQEITHLINNSNRSAATIKIQYNSSVNNKAVRFIF